MSKQIYFCYRVILNAILSISLMLVCSSPVLGSCTDSAGTNSEGRIIACTTAGECYSYLSSVFSHYNYPCGIQWYWGSNSNVVNTSTCEETPGGGCSNVLCVAVLGCLFNNICTNGNTQSCTTSNGCSGTQTCSSDQWGACQSIDPCCKSPDPCCGVADRCCTSGNGSGGT